MTAWRQKKKEGGQGERGEEGHQALGKRDKKKRRKKEKKGGIDTQGGAIRKIRGRDKTRIGH